MGDIVKSARNTFFSEKTWVYGQNHGGATNPNAFVGNQADCTYLVYQSNLHAGYNVPYLNTSSLVKNGAISPMAAKYYDVIDPKDAQPGDTVYYPAASQNANHVMVLTSWDGEANAGTALGAQSTNTGLKDGVVINEKGSYWQSPALILRPKVETYVPELDMTGGAGTGISAPRVAATVNLLKTEGSMEGYRPGIYTDSQGVPTTANGFALVVNGSNGYVLRSEDEIKGYFRLAGIPESKYDELPLNTLKQSVQELRSGDVNASKLLFGDGKQPGPSEVSFSPSEADRLTAAFIVSDTTPKIIAGLGGTAAYGEVTSGEFAAVAAGVYKNPHLLDRNPDLVQAVLNHDSDAASTSFGSSNRGQAEASAFAGNVNTFNEHLGSGQPPIGTANAPSGHWEDSGAYDPLAGPETGQGVMVWVPDSKSTPKPAAPAESREDSDAHFYKDKPASGQEPKTSNVTPAPAAKPTPGPAGDSIDSEMPDGTRMVDSTVTVNGVTTTTTVLQSTSGETLLQAGAGQTMQRDPDTGIVTVRAANGDEIGQYDPTNPNPVLKQLIDTFSDPQPYSKDNDVQLAAGEAFTLDPTPNQPAAPEGQAQPAINSGATGGDADTGTATDTSTATGAGIGTGTEAVSKTAASKPPTTTPGNLSTYTQATTFVQSVQSLSHWDQSSDAQHFAAVGGVLNSYNSLTGGSLGNLSGFNTLSSVVSLSNWDQTGDAAHINSLVALANNYNNWTEGSNALLSSNLTGLNQIAGYVNLAQNLQDGNVLGTLSSINSITGGAIDSAIDAAIDNAIGEALCADIPYVGILLALNDFSSHPGQSIGTLVGMYFGPVGSMIGGMIGGMLDGMAEHAPPPPPEGIIHYQWDAGAGGSGQISIAVDQDQSGGGAPAQKMGHSLLDLMQSMVQAINERTPGSEDDVALNPAHIPRIGYSSTGGMWMEVMLPGGLVTRESIDSATIATRLLQLLVQDGGLAPAWLVDTLQHTGQSLEQVQNHAAASADGKTQSYGAMVVHVQGNAALDGAIESVAATQNTANAQGSGIYRNVDGDPYLEHTQWVSATDANGNAQGLLVLDLNGNGVVETGDMLGDMHWLDANRDGVIDASDPAFAAIKLWVDINQDGILQAGEGQSLKALHITGFDLATGKVLYDDGSSSTMDVTALQADTAGIKQAHVQVVGEDGKLASVDAGVLIAHEAADGAEVTYDHYAKRTGDWEGTAEQDAHRHGGGNAEGAPTETVATGAISIGPILAGQPVIPSSRVEAGDSRIISNAPTAAPQHGPNKVVTIEAGDSRIASNAAPGTDRKADRPLEAALLGPQLAFITRSPDNAQDAMRIVTQEMIQSAQGGRAIGLDLAALAAIGLGAVQTTAFAAPQDFVSEAAAAPVVATADSMQWGLAEVVSDSGSVAPSSFSSTVDHPVREAAPLVFKHVDLGNLAAEPPKQASSTRLNQFEGATLEATLVVGPSEDDTESHGPARRFQDVDGGGAGLYGGYDLLPLDYPKVRGETLAGREDLVLRMGSSLLLANDSTLNAAADPTKPALSITSVGQPEHGQVSLQTHLDDQGRAVTEVLFAPDPDFHGTASFTYTVADQYGLSRSAIATLQIAAVNDLPVTSNESAQGDEDTGLVFDAAQLLANDWDPDQATDGQTLSISRVGDAQHGTAWMDLQGNVRFAPDANYHGPAQLTYWVSDSAGGETPATVSLVIAGTNDIPVAVGESATGDEDIGLVFTQGQLLANDSDPDTATDGQVLYVSRVEGAQHGTVWMDAQGNVRFAPEADYHGLAQFNYWVDDGAGGQSMATVRIALTAVNDAPVTANESATGVEDVGIVFAASQLLANDFDPDTATDNQSIHISRVGDAQNGVVWLDAQGNVRFDPNADYHGPATFNYWVADDAGLETIASVNLVIASVNDLPVVNGEQLNSDEDVVLLFAPSVLLANDTDADGDPLGISAVGNAAHGTVALVGGQVQFTPEANYNGIAQFDYTVSDGNGGTVTGTVVLSLAPINDAPEVHDDQLGTTPEGTPLHISFASLLGNDTDPDTGDTLTIDAVGSATHGSVAIVNGEVVFTPTAAYHGPASFVYRVVDGSGVQSTGLVTFNVSGVNDMPVAVGETIYSTEDTTLVISTAALLQNDTDPDIATDGQVLSVVAVSNAQGGTATLLGNGTVEFVPYADFYGNASFVYTISDGVGGTAQATATIVVANVNDAPIATGETVSGQAGQVLTISAGALLQNEYDSDNTISQLAINSVQSGVGGTVALNGSGDVVFTPAVGFTGTATFTYTVRDPSGEVSNSVTTSIVLSALPNTSPTVQGEIVTGSSEDAVFHIPRTTLLANDSDAEDANSLLSIVLVGSATNGTVALDGNGDIVFTPNANFNGNASFYYQVRDSQGAASATVQAVIPVAAVNDLPVAADDQFQTYKNSTMTIGFGQLTGNDSDVDGDTLTVGGVRNASHGSVSIVGGNVQFIPTAGFTGAASFEYLSDDGHGGQTWATAQVTVSNPPNLYPSMTVTYTNFYPTGSTPGGHFDMAFANMTPSDDGSVGAMSIQYVSGSYLVRPDSSNAGWQPLSNVGVNNFSCTLTSFQFDIQRWSALSAMQTVWQITDDQGLVNYWHFDYSMSGGLNSYMQYTGYAPPLVLALNNMPSEYIATQDSNVYFDMNGDGILDRLAWAAPGSGILGIDLNGDGRISEASEFAFKQYMHGAQTDLEGLVAFDSNHDGKLDSGDAQWSKFGVWEDKNSDGVTQSGEYKSLSELGIASIDLHSNGQMHTPALTHGATDVVVMGEGAFTRIDGSVGVTSDTMLTYQSGKDASAAHAAQMAQVFNQFCNIALNESEPPLGFMSGKEENWHAGMVLHPTDDNAMKFVG